MSVTTDFRRLIGGAGAVTVGNATAAGLGLLLLLLLARTLPPAELAIVVGVIAIIDGGQMFLDATINTGMVNVATRDSRQGEASPAILKAALWTKILAGLAFAALVALIAKPMSFALLGDGSMTVQVALAGVGAAVAGMHSFVIGVLQAREAFGRIAFVSVWKNMIRVVLVAPFLLIETPDARAAALAICGSTVLTLLASSFTISWSFVRASTGLWAGMATLHRVNRWMLLVAVSMLGGRLDVWLVGLLGSASEAGRFSVAAQLCVGIGIATQALVTTFLPTVSRFKTADDFGNFFRRWLRVLPLAVVIPAVVWPFSEPIIRALFGDAYAASAVTFNILFLAAIFTLFTAPLMLMLLSVGEARIMGLGSLAQFALRVGLAVPLVPALGGTGLAVADIVSRPLAMALIGYFLWAALRPRLSRASEDESASGPKLGAKYPVAINSQQDDDSLVPDCDATTVYVSCDAREAEGKTAAWCKLAGSAAEPNVFYEPWAFLPALSAYGGVRQTRILFVYQMRGERRTLIGVFPLEWRTKLRGLRFPHLAAWHHPQMFLASPLIDPVYGVAAWLAVLDWARFQGALVLDMPMTVGDGPGIAALDDALQRRGGRRVVIDQFTRTRMTKSVPSAEEYIKRASPAKSRKSWRRQKRRLAEAGLLEVRSLGLDESLETWVEQFLALEASGWKGRARTAMAEDDTEAAYFRTVCKAAHARNALHMLGLFVDQRPVAMQCNLFSGGNGFAFKVAYDEAWSAYSPGVLLELEAIYDFFGREGFVDIDSCTGAGCSVMSRIWSGSITIERQLISPGGVGGFAAVKLLPRLQRIQRSMWALRNRLRTNRAGEGAAS